MILEEMRVAITILLRCINCELTSKLTEPDRSRIGVSVLHPTNSVVDFSTLKQNDTKIQNIGSFNIFVLLLV